MLGRHEPARSGGGRRLLRGLFGWEFEDAIPLGSNDRHFIARLRGGDVAAVGSQPEGGPAIAVWNTYVWPLPLPLHRYSGGALDAAIERVRERFGTTAVTRAVLLGRDTGS